MPTENRWKLPDRGIRVASELTELGVKLPKGVTAAIDHYKLVEGRKPIAPTVDDLADSYFDAKATDEDRDLLALHIVAANRKITAWNFAHNEAGDGVQRALQASIDDLVEQLRPQAQAAIDELHWFVANGRPTLEELVKTGRTDDATRAAHVEIAWGRLSHLIDVRDRALGQKARFVWSIWTDPTIVEELKLPEKMPIFDRILHSIAAGGELCWSTLEQARATHADRAEAKRRLIEAQAQERRDAIRRAV